MHSIVGIFYAVRPTAVTASAFRATSRRPTSFRGRAVLLFAFALAIAGFLWLFSLSIFALRVKLRGGTARGFAGIFGCSSGGSVWRAVLRPERVSAETEQIYWISAQRYSLTTVRCSRDSCKNFFQVGIFLVVLPDKTGFGKTFQGYPVVLSDGSPIIVDPPDPPNA